MHASLLFILLMLTGTCLGQQQRKVNGYATLQYTKTFRDLTIGNNPWGIGTGVQVFFNVLPWFRPTLEITGDVYLENDKTLRMGPDDQPMPSITSISKALAGPTFEVARLVNVGVMAGVSFVNADVLLTVKPSLTVFVNKRQSFFIKVSYIHVNDRGWVVRDDFTSGSIGLGLKIF